MVKRIVLLYKYLFLFTLPENWGWDQLKVPEKKEGAV